MTCAELKPICSSKASLTSSKQPSLRRAISRMSGHCWNTEANFCSDRRRASSAFLVSLISIIRPRITGLCPCSIRLTISRTHRLRPSAQITR
ncbi:hypothetical protein D3C76_1321450 [compost metagenome]